MANDRERKIQEREKLKSVIDQWNANRLDIFWLSEPNEEMEFHGAMRFYFQDAGQKVATKCIRVASTATTSDVIETLIEKFRPDIRMLSIPEYALYEIHENGEERKLRGDEKPLLVQLDWHRDDREGRFLLRRMDEKSYISSMDACDNMQFKRKLSKREKKEKKRQEKKEKLRLAEESKKDGIAERLYSELPETSFTRSISNPEAVMRRRRHQILEQKLKQFCQEGGTDAGGTLRIFGESLNKDVPYKTLLLSTKDNAAFVVKEILDKYGYDKEDPVLYCLVQVIVPHHSPNDGPDFQSSGGIREYILDDDDCPLMIQHQHNRGRGTLTFHVRRRPADYQPRKRKKKPKPTKEELEYRYGDASEKLPYLLELNSDGTESHGPPKKHRLYLNVTEVGSERSSSTGGQYLQLFGPNVQPRHCVIAHTERIITVTPSSRDAETYVNNMRIYETTILQNGMVVRFGKLHTFRFIDPLHDQKLGMLPDPRQHPEFIERSRRDDQLSLHPHSSYETTFDTDGNVETVSTHSRDERLSKKSDDALSHRSLGRESSQGRGSFEKFEQKRGNDPILPAVLEFWEEGEDPFLTAAISQLDPSQVQFKLSPTYALYMAARYRASTHFRPDTTPSDRAHRLTALMNKVATVLHQVIQDRYREAPVLAFWLANTSELLHFLKQDRHLSAYTLDAQDLLAESVQLAFRNLITCYQLELQDAMPAFLEERDDINEEEGTTANILAVLASAMSLLRPVRVNAALTIQMFSQLFHFINMWLFNKVVLDTRPNYCTRLWGVHLKRRMGRVEAWAEKQGLELAADCHLSRIVQAAHLLQAPKRNSEELASISSLCFKLNSLQLHTLLEKYQPAEDEPHIPRELIDSVVKVAENTADEQARSEGREIKLEEDTNLQLPFLLPEDGYSCDIVRGVPPGLQEFLLLLIQAGLCRLTIQPTSSGYWTIYMSDQDIGRIPSGARSPSVHSHVDEGSGNWKQPEPEVATLRLQKSNNGIGLSIVAAGGADQDKLGIYVRSVVKGGAADLDGRLQAGDQLLKVDGQSLIGVNQEKAAELMTRTGPVVTLEVAKQAAIFNGLSDVLSKPSPIIQRDLTLYQRQHAYGLPPSGCEAYHIQHSTWKSSNSQTCISFSNSEKYHIGLPNTCPHRWETVQTLERSKRLTNHRAQKNFIQLKNRIPGLPTQFTNLSKPRSEESLPNCSVCPHCLNCRKQDYNLRSSNSVLYDGRNNSCNSQNVGCNPGIRSYMCIIRTADNQGVGSCQGPSPYSTELGCSHCSCCVILHSPVDAHRKMSEHHDPAALADCVRKKLSLSLPVEPFQVHSGEKIHSADCCPHDTSKLQEFNRPRRMSERDIPTRIMNDHGQEGRLPPGPAHLMPPRMQSSKSVPSLNSNHEPDPARPNGNVRSQEMYNPAYSHTSSTASIPKAADFPEHGPRSKSANNLRQEQPVDPRFQYNNAGDDSNPPPYPGPPGANMNGRPMSHPNLLQPQVPHHPLPPIPASSQQNSQEERHYQNISMYQQHQQQQQPQQPNANIRPPAQPYPQQPQHPLHSSQSSLNRPEPQGLQSPIDRSRPLSTLVSPREQEQYASSMGYSHPHSGPPRSPKATPHGDAHHGQQNFAPRPLHDQRDFRSADHLRMSESDARSHTDTTSYQELNSNSYPMHGQEYVHMQHLDPRQRDLLRQEAKMEEMREEVRRREDRERMMLQQQMQHQMGRGANWRGPNPIQVRPPPTYHHGSPSGPPHAAYPMGPPPPAPKPRPQHFNNPVGDRFQRPAGYTDGYPDVHVNQQHPAGQSRFAHQPPPVVSYRYGPSGYPPRSEDGTEQKVGARPIPTDVRSVANSHGKPSPPVNQSSRVTFDLPQHAGNEDKKETSNLMSPSPWEREEKEKIALGVSGTHYNATHGLMHKQRLEEARRARDEEIRDLESRPHLTPQQGDRLRALRLEQEFQRRAEELHGEEDDDEDEDLLDRAETRERKLKMQEDLERARQRRLEWEIQQTQNQLKLQQQQMSQNDDWKRQQLSLEEQEKRLRQLRVEENQRKRELEVAKNDEERLLREARRRQDEFNVPNNVPYMLPPRPSMLPMNQQELMLITKHQQMLMNLNYGPQKGSSENLNHQDTPPPLPTSPPPMEPSYQALYNQKPASMRSHRLSDSSQPPNDKLLEPPAPPARKSSYEVTNQMSSNNRYAGSSMRNCDNQPHPAKKVSFHDAQMENNVGCDTNGNHNPEEEEEDSQSYTLDDINEVLSTPHNSQNLNTYSPGNTPGVIGLQEVYRDPRQRIEAERTQLERGGPRNPGPEKLTFKEKMKMFAQEVGEQETPKDRVKISKAQREIETNLNGS